jgi:hypothetical protein
MKKEVTLQRVETFDTRGGNVRFVVRDEDGNEYSTFREEIGGRARQLEGRRALIEFHETRRGNYTNVYLDKVEPIGPEPSAAARDTDPQEAAWRTAVEAAPWLVGEAESEAEVSPNELYEKLKPFKDRVAKDITENGED